MPPRKDAAITIHTRFIYLTPRQAVLPDISRRAAPPVRSRSRYSFYSDILFEYL